MLALATCRTVDDFAVILDSLHNAEGITRTSNYGTFDAFGGAVMYETGAHSYIAVDVTETREGYVVRSNYSYSGDPRNNNYDEQLTWGKNRHDRAFDLWKNAVENNNLTPQFILQQVSRNLHAEGMENYQLPYEDYYQNFPYGLIPNRECICRSGHYTRSVFVGQGVQQDERPDGCIIWAMAGNPLGSVVTPLWVRAGSVPEEFDSPDGSCICTRAMEISEWIYERGNFPGVAVNTFKLFNDNGTGYWDWLFPIEDMIFERVERFINSPGFSFDRLEGFQNAIAHQAADSMANWRPSYAFAELSEPVFYQNRVILYWDEPNVDVFNRIVHQRGYNVYRSTSPFREEDCGQLLTFVENNRYIDNNPPQYGAYYRVEVVY